ncbi:MAG: Fe(3+) transporter substrate-binding protein [Crocinitomicaceae bacterium]|jgi:iron(III) transport system substrate-binding protein|nr:Fe(3+) transporter substrate-binding protein [Crocinitomicaceae bacterium]
MKRGAFFWIFLWVLVHACTVNDAREPRKQYVHVFTDHLSHQDSLLFKKFFREEKIKVHVHHVQADSLLELVKNGKYNSDVDLILLGDYAKIYQFSSRNLFLHVKSEVLEKNIDPVYRSRHGKWFALSKSALVLAYNKKVLTKDTISGYYDLIHPKWAGKIAFQQPASPTLVAFNRNIRLLMKSDADTFLYRFYRQRNAPYVENDFRLLEKIKRQEAQLALVKLSAVAEYQLPGGKHFDRSRLDVSVIFPNQRKRGCYFTITGGGVYRYAKNPMQAQKLLEFLSGKRAQYLFAEGRLEYPILKDVEAHYLLKSYGKVRGRFYKNKRRSRSNR